MVKPSSLHAGSTLARRCCWLSRVLPLLAVLTTMVTPHVAEDNGGLGCSWKT